MKSVFGVGIDQIICIQSLFRPNDKGKVYFEGTQKGFEKESIEWVRSTRRSHPRLPINQRRYIDDVE